MDQMYNTDTKMDKGNGSYNFCYSKIYRLGRKLYGDINSHFDSVPRITYFSCTNNIFVDDNYYCKSQ